MPRYRERRSRPAPNPASPLWQLPASAREVVREATPVGDATLVSVVLALGVPGRLPGLEAPGLPVVEALLAPLATTLPEGASPGAIGCEAHQRDTLRPERLRLTGERLLRGDLVRLRLLVDLGLHLIVRESRAAPDEEAAEHEQDPGGGDRGRETDPESGALALRRRDRRDGRRCVPERRHGRSRRGRDRRRSRWHDDGRRLDGGHLDGGGCAGVWAVHHHRCGFGDMAVAVVHRCSPESGRTAPRRRREERYVMAIDWRS